MESFALRLTTNECICIPSVYPLTYYARPREYIEDRPDPLVMVINLVSTLPSVSVGNPLSRKPQFRWVVYPFPARGRLKTNDM